MDMRGWVIYNPCYLISAICVFLQDSVILFHSPDILQSPHFYTTKLQDISMYRVIVYNTAECTWVEEWTNEWTWSEANTPLMSTLDIWFEFLQNNIIITFTCYKYCSFKLPKFTYDEIKPTYNLIYNHNSGLTTSIIQINLKFKPTKQAYNLNKVELSYSVAVSYFKWKESLISREVHNHI